MRQRSEQEHRKQVEDKAEYILKMLPILFEHNSTHIHKFKVPSEE